MDLLQLETTLHHYPNIIAAAVVITTLMAVFVALYLGSSFHEIRRAKKIKITKFKNKIKLELNKELMSIYIDFLSSHKGQNWKIQDASTQNVHTPNFLKLSRKVFSNDIANHKEELEYYEFLKKKKLILNCWTSVLTKSDSTFLYYEYGATPTIKSWNYIEKIYKNYPKEKAMRKMWIKFIDTHLVENRSKRKFLQLIFKKLKN